MSVQVPLFENVEPKVSKMAAAVEEIVSAGFDVNNFVQNFEVIAAASGGMAHVRSLVLELAFKGLLTSPNAGDDLDLLDRLAAARARPSEARQWQAREYDDVPQPESLRRDTWTWVRLGDIVRDAGQKVPTDPFSYVDVSSIDNVRGAVLDDLKILQPHEAPSRARKLVEPGAVIYSTVRPYLLNVAVVDRLPTPGPIASTAFAVLIPLAGIVSRYLYWLLRSPIFVRYVSSQMKGVAYPAISDRQLYSGWIPLPPIPEQKRIVAKVDQLMTLCDELAARQTNKREVSSRLTKSALEALTSAEGPEEFDVAWKRVVENFDALIDRAENVAELRAVVRDLAISGRVGSTGGGSSAQEGRPFALPQGWQWAVLGDLCETITKGSSPKWQGVQYVKTPAEGILFVTSENVGSGRLLLDKPKYVEAKFNEIEPRSKLRRGDLLMNIVGASIGRVAVFDRDDIANINQAVCIIRLSQHAHVDRAFMLLFLNSPTCIGYMFDKQVDNARANLSMGNISKFLVPLPPIEQQKAIVAKVEQLMKVCDDLEARLRQAEDRASKLVEAAVQELVA